jgi:hypothetical protein
MSLRRAEKAMRDLAHTIDWVLNGDEGGKERKIVFALLVFPGGGPEGAMANWISNGKREDMVVALKEIIARFEGEAAQRGTA